MAAERLGAVSLCGGESRRMGRPKAWLPFGGQTLLEWMVDRVWLAMGEGPVVVVAAAGQELPALPPGVVVTRDAVYGRGPLQGLAAGMAALPTEIALVYATAVDTPFLAPGWILGLVQQMAAAEVELVIPWVEGYRHPLAALYRRSVVLPVMETMLAAGQFRLSSLEESLRARVLGPEILRGYDPELATLRNLNTPEEYERALAEWPSSVLG